MKRTLRITLVSAVVLLLALGTLWVGDAWWESRLPATYNAMALGTPDLGGGAGDAHHHGAGGLSIANLTGQTAGAPDAAYTLRAAHTSITLPSGRQLDALAFNGVVPGPELRVRRGDLVQVTLVNEDVAEGVTLHWHGVDVPNAEDGVAGVTQDAVEPGGRFVYRFRAEQQGTFWYHSHQVSSKEVRRGLFGTLVIEPSTRPTGRSVDLTAAIHRFGGVTTIAGSDGGVGRAVAPGTQVRLRLVNTDSVRDRVLVAGTPFRVLAIDGTDIHAPTSLRGEALEIAGGGRFDIGFRMPSEPVSIAVARTGTRLVLSGDGVSAGESPADGPTFDPATYGSPAPVPFDAASRFDRTFKLEIGRSFGFYDGRPGRQWTINGHIFPDVPMFIVSRGDLVKVAIVNATGSVHPMHLHGHHALVLRRNGKPVSGSPWWTDTLDVGGHERYEVAFRADNPGIWMDHCHNLSHAAKGLTMHLAYSGFRTPFVVGGSARNQPE